MGTIDLGAAPPVPDNNTDSNTDNNPDSILAGLPRRVSLTLTELLFVAERAGGAPLPFDLADDRAGAALDGRLGPAPAAGDRTDLEAVVARLREPRSSLSRRGLLVDTELDEGLLGAIGLLAAPMTAVDLDVTAGRTRVRAWHRQRGGAVAALATADGVVFELAWYPVDDWGDELARVAVVPEDLSLRPTVVPDHLELPRELLDAAAEAVRTGRTDLLPVLAAQHGVPPGVVPAVGALVGEVRGRLRALVADATGGRTTVVGVVSWILLTDGWRALQPRRDDRTDRVVIARVQPSELAIELAPVLAEVRA